jgi:sugar (pentulose or hexulose) kinase
VLNLGTLGSLCFGLQAGQSFPEGCISSVWLSEHDATQTKRRRSFFAEIIHFSCGSLLQELGSRLQEDGSAYSLRALSGLADSASAEIPVWFYAPRGEATPAWQLRLPTIISRQERLSKSAAARIYFENIAFALALAYQHLRGQGVTIERLLALGGASVCQPILRWFAQITRVSVICSEPQVGATQALTQGSAWGAALAARYGMSVLQEGAQKLSAPVPNPASFEPLETRAEAAVAERYALWCALRQQALTGEGRYAELPAEQRSGSIVLK